MTQQLLELWKSSSLVQGTMALIATAAIIYLALNNRPIPDILLYIVSTVVGFYFGTKNRISSE